MALGVPSGIAGDSGRQVSARLVGALSVGFVGLMGSRSASRVCAARAVSYMGGGLYLRIYKY